MLLLDYYNNFKISTFIDIKCWGFKLKKSDIKRFSPISGIASGKFSSKNCTKSQALFKSSNFLNGMKSVTVQVLSCQNVIVIKV